MTREGCHGCEAAIAAVRRVCDEHGARYEAVDVDADPELRGEYGDRVPVILVDGAEHGYWRVDEVRLARALNGS